MTALERALVDLVRKAATAPARLTASDLDPLRSVAGDDALDYAVVVAAFHFINRVADLLHIDPEVLPESLRRFEPLRRIVVRVTSVLMRRMDLGLRPYPSSFADAVASAPRVLQRATDGKVAAALAPIASRPKLVELLGLALEERERSRLDVETVARIHHAVEAALPARPEDAEGFHARPTDPVEAFAFVGTRYAARATEEMIEALRRAGYDDLGILDLAIAVACANQWARLFRLSGLAPELFYVGGVARRSVA